MSSCDDFFWLMSLPLKHREINQQRPEIIFQDRQILFSYLRDKLVTVGDVCHLFPIDLPEFKTGTLDSLVILNDQLAKFDPQVENVVLKFSTNLSNLLDGDREKVRENSLVFERSPGAYIRSFTWNKLKYRIDEPITTIMNTLVEEVEHIDTNVKNKLSTYHHAKTHLNTLTRKKGGNLINRNLTGLVKSTDILTNSEYLQSVLFVIPRNEEAKWLNEYETLIPLGAVPRSARSLHTENEHILYVIVVIQKYVQEYIQAATSKGYVARTDFQFDPEAQSQEGIAVEKLESDVKSQWSSLIRLLKINFGEIFSAWIHLKMLRLHVESILHYGLPPTFLTIILQPTKNEKKIRKILLHALEKLELPGISQIELVTALLEAGIKTTNSTAGSTSYFSETDAAEEAELWSTLAANEGGSKEIDPFVNLSIKWNPNL